MALREEFETAGNWLFKRRSYLPLFLFPIPLSALFGFRNDANLGFAEVWGGLCVVTSVLGLGVRVATVGFVPGGTSGRNTSEQTAAVLNTTGTYSVMRHPLYFGNYLMWLGVASFPRRWWSPVLVSLVFWLYYERIMFAEEEFLRRKFGAAYLDWAARTPAMVPKPGLWRPAAHGFSIRTILRREYPGLFALVACFSTLDLVRRFAGTGRFDLHTAWSVTFAMAAVLFGVLRALKRRTHLLCVEGR